MIYGAVSARLEAVVPVRVRGPRGAILDLDAVVDTGFTASLTLPSTAVVALGLNRQSGGGACWRMGPFGNSIFMVRR